MTCAACGHPNPERAKFCLECGTPLAARCASCGTELPAAAKFCLECGAAVKGSGDRSQVSGPETRHPPGPLSGTRKVVTIVFGDLVGSTALHERLDAEAVRQFMERYYAAMRGAVEAHGGRVTQVMGDGVKAVFGAPRVAEDDALRAVRAAVAMQRAFAALAEQQRGRVGKTGLRVAVNTGEVVTEEGQEIIGDPVNVAARLQEQGKDGDVVIGGTTQRLVARFVTLDRLGSFALKGRTEAVEAYRVVSLEPPAGATIAAFVGRDAELARIAAVYQAAITQPAARLAVVLGSPGLGKSRLIDESTHRLGHAATVLTAHCNATGGATFAPVAEALREWLRALRTDRPDPTDPSDPSDDSRAALDAALPSDHADRARILTGIEALLAGSPASPEETFFVVRRFLAALAAMKPVVLVIDDLHWAEPLLLDLVEHLIQWGSGVPLLVLVGARPELRDSRSALATTGGLVTDVITLGGLDAGAATRLAANVLGAADLPTAVAAKVLATSEGNPLFVAELVRMLVQEGALTKEGDRWTAGAGLAALEMPPTIHALLAARIERLRPEERAVLERAAVVGRHFSRSAVAALLGRDLSELDARLEALRRAELIERDTGWFLGEPVLRFHHVLIRDAAYRRLLKGTRAELHARLADWIEAQVPGAPRTPEASGGRAEHDETIGWHLEQAHQLLSELGPLDDSGRALGERASQRLSAAGRRALAHDDVPLAAGLLGRAVDRLNAGNPARAELALDWCEALLSAGDVGPAAKAIAELGRFAGATDRTDRSDPTDPSDARTARFRAWHTCFTGQLTALTAPQGLQATAAAVAAAAAELAQLGDAAGEAKAHSVHAQALARLGRVGACEAALDKALAAARRAGDRRRANAVLAGAPVAALWGPSPVTRASGRCLDVVRVLRITQGAPAVEAVALSCQGVLEALRGRTDAARRMIASSRKMVEELGIAHRLFEADVFAGRIDLLEGDADAAARNLRGAYDGLRELGLGIDAARAAALLARALLAQGKAAEAEALSYESETLAGDDLQAAIAWRGVRAEALARRGETTAAVELAHAAVAIAAATDALLDHADARLALAAALRAAGRAGEADAENRRASELWEAKGATLLAERLRPEKRLTETVPTATRAEATWCVRRRVRGNAATASAARFDAAFAAADIGAIEACFSDAADMRVIDHPTESTYGRAGAVDSYRRLLRLKDPVVCHEPLATLGESLGLFRRRIAADGTSGGRFDVGDVQREEFVITEPDVLVEIFAADRLADAIARLYQRHAQLLPDGKLRRRAEATASSVARMLAVAASRSVDQLPAALSPSVESIDHRQLGLPPGRGADELSRDVGALFDLAADLRIECTDVLRLEANALLHHLSMCGTDRSSGGLFEFPVLLLWLFDDDGLLARWEVFDPERPAQALARFDELTGLASLPLEKGGQEGFVQSAPEQIPLLPPFSKGEALRRRVRPNTASAVMARMEVAFAARDLDAVAALLAESMENVDHPTESAYGRAGQIESSRRMMRTPGLEFHLEVLATLGDTLCLIRRRVTASGTAGGAFDVGAYEMEHVGICEFDTTGRCRSFEVFTTDRLGDAVPCLYQRYAASLPAGPARTRAAAIARTLSHMVAPPDLARYAAALAPTVEFVDHRTVGFASGRGADKLLRGFRSLFDLATEIVTRVDDVLALDTDAILLRWTIRGMDRATGGPFESIFLLLWLFGPDGRVVRDETFDAEREAEALARFDELCGKVAPPPEEERVANAATRADVYDPGQVAQALVRFAELADVRFLLQKNTSRAVIAISNVATAAMERAWAAFDAHDFDAVRALCASRFTWQDRRPLVGLSGDVELMIASARERLASGARHTRREIIGTAGDRVAVARVLWAGGPADGRFEVEFLVLHEIDEAGLCTAMIFLDPDDPRAAQREAWARWTAIDPTAADLTALLGEIIDGWNTNDLERLRAAFAEDLIVEDHRRTGIGRSESREVYLQSVAALWELAPESRFEAGWFWLAIAPQAGVYTGRRAGRLPGGGEFETDFLVVATVEGGRTNRVELFEIDAAEAALARFDELRASHT